jgi:hypothetical protein
MTENKMKALERIESTVNKIFTIVLPPEIDNEALEKILKSVNSTEMRKCTFDYIFAYGQIMYKSGLDDGRSTQSPAIDRNEVNMIMDEFNMTPDELKNSINEINDSGELERFANKLEVMNARIKVLSQYVDERCCELI